MKIVIVGGVAGGASAAARARRLSEQAEIVVFERGRDVSFANCGLPYYLGNEIEDRDKLLVAKRSLLTGRYRLDVRTRTEVEAIDRQARVVRVHDLDRGRRYLESYDKLILATGAAPLRPAIPGIALPGIFTLRNLEDVDRVKQVVDGGIRRALIIGAGFIGLELAENLVRRGIETTVVELQDQVLPPLDREMTTPLAEGLRAHGVRLELGQAAQAFEPTPDGLRVRLTSGETHEAQLALLGIGVRPESRLAVDAGLAVGPRGGIRVDEHMRTADADIYAVGDAIETTDYVSGAAAQIPLAGPANRQGRIAADHIFGRESRFRGAQGTAIVRLFERTAAITGLSEKALKSSGTPHLKVYIHPSQHAGYYPGARPMTIKLLFAPDTGRILGAQVVGEEGVDTRIDVLAVAIQAGMTVFDLEEAELAYAPQFGSAKDAINMAGFVAAAVVRGDYPQIHADEPPMAPAADSAMAPTPFWLDVRTPAEFAAGHIPGATNRALDELRAHLGQIPRDRKIAVYCQAGQRGYVATLILRQAGFDACNLAGGFKTYRMFHTNSRP
jgi:NADPH-dependent 2,4-dienoyl-CoA reductase/sulfur reductase-like enzyme/rhodanese-related sulfurtransferase